MLRRMGTLRVGAFAIAVTLMLASPGAAAGRQNTRVAAIKRGIDGLVAAQRGPRGVIVTLSRGRHFTVVKAGRADIAHGRPPRSTDHMRIASVAKAFNGAVVLRLVQQHRIGLGDTIGARLPKLPAAWRAVTVREMLGHTGGLPDYTKSDGFVEHLSTHPAAFVSPATVIGWVAAKGLDFRPGSRYEYSNTDNIVLGLIAEKVTGTSYGSLLRTIVFGPARLRATTFPTTIALPAPFIHGYAVAANGTATDVSRFINPTGAWASGGIISTPADLNRFIRRYLTPSFFGAAQQRAQLRFVAGSSSPPGPGTNAAGLAVFRYRTRCGTVYGHTGNFPGYTQFAAATRNGRRAVTMSLNIAAPSGALLARLRAVQTTAVCALLR